MNDARNLLKFLKYAAQAPPQGGGGPPGGFTTPLNPVQLAVQQQQAAAMGDPTPQGNPEIMKAQESSMQAQQQAGQQVAQAQQQAQEQVMAAQQQVQQAEMKAQQQAQGMIQKLQGQLDAARTQITEAKAEAELSKLEKQKAEMIGEMEKHKAELFKPEAIKPDPVAPGPDYRPTLKRMSGRIGKALARLERVSPHLKLAADYKDPSTPIPPAPTAEQLPYTVQPDGTTIDIDARPKTHTPQQSRGYNNPGAGTVLQDSGYYHKGIYTDPGIRPSLGTVGDQVLKAVKGYANAPVDWAQHLRSGPFSTESVFSGATPLNWLNEMPNMQQQPWWQQMAAQMAGGFTGQPVSGLY